MNEKAEVEELQKIFEIFLDFLGERLIKEIQLKLIEKQKNG